MNSKIIPNGPTETITNGTVAKVALLVMAETDIVISVIEFVRPFPLNAHAVSAFTLKAGRHLFNVRSMTFTGTGTFIYASTVIIPSVLNPPEFTDFSSISTNLNVGQTLTLLNVAASGNPIPTFSYSWDKNLGGTWTTGVAFGSTYLVDFADLGYTFRCNVTAQNSQSSILQTTPETNPIQP